MSVARQKRRAQTASTRDLVEAISAVLFEADPIGINFETNKDEYDAEAESIVIALPSMSGPDDVRAMAHEVFVQWFGTETAGSVERYGVIAERVWTLWRRYQG